MPKIDEQTYLLLNSFLTVIKQLTTGVDYTIKQNYIKLAIINTKISSKAVLIVIYIASLYTFCRV